MFRTTVGYSIKYYEKLTQMRGTQSLCSTMSTLINYVGTIILISGLRKRNLPVTKGYVCWFVCLAIRAAHLVCKRFECRTFFMCFKSIVWPPRENYDNIFRQCHKFCKRWQTVKKVIRIISKWRKIKEW